MKIAVTHTRYTRVGGSEGYIVDLVRRLLDAGHEVHYFCQWWEEGADPRIVFREVPHRWKPIRFLKVREFDRAIDRLVPLGAWDVVHGFSKTSRQDVYTDGSGCLEDYQAYTLQDGESGGPIARALRRLSFHQREVLAIERRRFTRGNFRKIVAMSELAARQIRGRYQLDATEVEVVYNGCDVERFRPENVARFRREERARLAIDDGAFVALIVANDWKRKGVSTLVEAAAEVRRQGGLGRPLKVVVVGKERPSRARELERLARERGVAGDVLFVGPHRNVEAWHALADVFVLPSRFDIFGNVVLEALATGVPAIVSAAAGASEVLEEGKNGFVLPDARDAGLVARRLRELAGDGERRRVLGAAARETALRYSWDRHFARILAIYEDVARAKRGRA